MSVDKVVVERKVLSLWLDSFINRLLIKKNCYITVSNNDNHFFKFRCTPGLKYAVELPSSHGCRSFQNGRRPIQLYIFGKGSPRSLQKCIVLLVCDVSVNSYNRKRPDEYPKVCDSSGSIVEKKCYISANALKKAPP